MTVLKELSRRNVFRVAVPAADMPARERFSDDTELAAIEAMLPLWSRGDVASSRERYAKVRPNVGDRYVMANIDRDLPGPTVAYDLDTMALVLALQGQKSRAIAIAEEATRIVSLQDDKVEGPSHLQTLCQVLALTGERDRALEIMAQQIDKPGGSTRWELTLDPRWDFFRDDERFNDLVRPLSLVE